MAQQSLTNNPADPYHMIIMQSECLNHLTHITEYQKQARTDFLYTVLDV